MRTILKGMAEYTYDYKPQEWRTPMASIEIILRDDDGNIINQKTQKRYSLGFDKERIAEIEEAVEGFKRESLPDITYDVLASAQQQQTEQIKKQNR
jgi:hypothetical protein